MILVHDNKVTAEEAAKILGKSVRTVRQYTTRGVKLLDGTRWTLPTAGLDNDGQRLYYLRDLAKVHNSVTRRGQSRADTVPLVA